jgi:hypothetical protein
VVVIVLLLLYWREARSGFVGSDAASNVLQGSDMLHGNLLLHGWFTSDVSFYGTELMQYMLLQMVLTMSTGVVYVAGAMTYTILVFLAGWLAKGRASGREGIVRACVGAGVMLASALGTFMPVRAPDHLGSAVPVLLVWLVIDRCPRRWWVPAVVCVLLAWGVVADPLIEITGAAAIAGACRDGAAINCCAVDGTGAHRVPPRSGSSHRWPWPRWCRWAWRGSLCRPSAPRAGLPRARSKAGLSVSRTFGSTRSSRRRSC